MNDTILEVKNLTVAFGGNRVVDNLSYTLQRGTTLGIVGESGSGKSISSLALMGLLPRQAAVSGSALLGDTDLLTLDESAFRPLRGARISMIFQEPMTSLNPVKRCGHQVMEMLLAHEHVDRNEARRRTLQLFDEVLLPRPEKIFRAYPHEISGGQKQRVMIAMAMICQPDILIADEPTTALDVTVQKTILQLMRDMQQRRGTAILFISHDLGVIGQVADNILVMYRGKTIEQGNAHEILHHPQQPYTRGLLACRPPLDSRPRRLPTVDDFIGNIPPDTTQMPRKPLSQGTPLISVRDLAVTYTLKKNLLGKPLTQLQAVDGITFDIMEGETLGLVGESGCGKSTLGRAMLRLIDHSAGNISYRGTRLDKLSAHQMRQLRPRLQIVFQDPYSSLNPRQTIGNAIAEPLRVHSAHGNRSRKDTMDTVVDLMQQVGLEPDWYDRYPHQLSGGQRQRVCIARALILKPELLVCDESVSALDVSVQAQVLNLLNDLKERHHLTYLFITHDLSVVHYFSDRILVMQQGRLVESGSPDDLFLHPQTDYTRTLVDAIPRID